ncbi:MAG TPA: hypothetical protein VHN99_08275, partial [Deinococcales bacterium]|nr:hypothetical protein [Deinococcales bacterium]
LDFGHAVVEGGVTDAREGRSAGGLEAGLARLRDYQASLTRVIHLHLHDNDGTADLHRPIGRGGLDYAASRDYLLAFTGTACLEIGGDATGVRESVANLRALLAGEREGTPAA